MPQRKTIFWNGIKYNLNSALFSDSPYNDNPKLKPLFDYYSNFVLNIFDEEYQSKIDWEQTYHIDEAFELSFVFIRATAGKNKVDARFKENWKASKERQLIRGAYHYYRPNENSLAQAENFIQHVNLEQGDLPPVLDIEKLPNSQSIDSLKVGLRRWLKKVEKHYKVKPIIYSGESYYTDFLKREFKEYPLWIANYNFWRNHLEKDWLFWQFTEKAQIAGIKGMVDLNVFNGDKNKLQFKCIQ